VLANLFRQLFNRHAPAATGPVAANASATETGGPPPGQEWPYQLFLQFERLRLAWLAEHGPVVQGGPFAGLRYHDNSVEGCYLPKVMGTYEAELFGVLQSLPGRGYRKVLNIGCADGYYAVGLARLLGDVPVWCCDIDPKAIAATRALAAANDVAGRVSVNEMLFRPGDFSSHAGPDTLVFIDIEGAEDELLAGPAPAALAACDLIVEAHDCFIPGLSENLAERFAATHEVEVLTRRNLALNLPEATSSWSDTDRALATSEWGSGPTPWLWMRARGASR
jgi:hypothetical protein